LHIRPWPSALVLLLLAPAAVADQQDTGVVFLLPGDAYTPQLSALCDTILNTVAGLHDRQAVLLHFASPLLGDQDAREQFRGLADDAQDLGSFAATSDLDEILLVRIVMPDRNAPTAEMTITTFWGGVELDGVRSFEITVPALTPAHLKIVAQRFRAHIAAGFETAQLMHSAPPTKPAATDTHKPTPAPETTQTPPSDKVEPDTTDTPPEKRPDTATDRQPVPVEKPETMPIEPGPSTPMTSPPARTDKPAAPTGPATPVPVTAPADKPAPPAMRPPPAKQMLPSPPGDKPSLPEETAAKPAAEIGPHTALARQALAVGDLEATRRELNVAMRSGEPLFEAHLLRAELARVEGDTREQRISLERASRVDPTSVEPQLRLATLYYSQGLWQKAVSLYDEAIELAPDATAAYVGAAAIFTNRNRPKEAAAYLAEAATRNPQAYSLLMKLGDAYRMAKMFAEAEEAYQLAARTPDPDLRSQVFDRLGDLYVVGEQYADGFSYYAGAARLRQDHSSPLGRKRYQIIMATADRAVMSNLQSAADAFNRYLADTSVPRQYSYRASELADQRIRDVIEFAELVVPPAEARQLHLRRQLFYSLALEAAVSLTTHLDTNIEVALKQYQRAKAEAESEFEQLRALADA